MDGRRPGQSGLLRGGNWMQRDQWEHIRARPGSERTIFGTPVPGSLLESLGRLRREAEAHHYAQEEQRRQALTAILAGLVIMVLAVIIMGA